MRFLLVLVLGLFACACSDDPSPTPSTPQDSSSPPQDTRVDTDLDEDTDDIHDMAEEDLAVFFPTLQPGQVGVLVLLDGVPAPATNVMQVVAPSASPPTTKVVPS